jgi:FkbM family methyltransferase
VGLFFPDGVSSESEAFVRDALRPIGLTASDLRRVLGTVDQQASPSPFAVRLSADDVTFVSLDGIEVALDRADSAVSGPVLAAGGWEPHVEVVLRQLLSSGSVFVDVGANIGWHTMLASSIVGERGFVYALEPNPNNARLIAQTISTNHLSNVALLPFALGDQIGHATFRTAIGSNGCFVGRGDVSYLDPYLTIVPTLRLDDLEIERVDVIKIDVEGAEPQVLEGASATIERDHPAIVFEFSCEMTRRLGGCAPAGHLKSFQELGYHLSMIERPTGDLLAVPDVDAFLRDWGNPLRIEDFVAQPS